MITTKAACLSVVENALFVTFEKLACLSDFLSGPIEAFKHSIIRQIFLLDQPTVNC